MRWTKDVHNEWIDAIKSDKPGVHGVIEAAKTAYGWDMAAFLCWLGVRLMECHRVLDQNGSLFLHIDHTAHAWVKCIMDDIFGRHNFRNEIVWAYTSPSNTKRWFPRKHDTILWYSKGKQWTFNRDDILIAYSDSYINRFNKRYNESAGKSRIFSKGHDTKRNQELAKQGKTPEDWWSDISPVGRLKNENTRYPTQKPLALLERIIKACTNEGDMVLDPFVGCATTPVAAEQLGRQWIGMDIWTEAHAMVLERLQRYNLAVPDAQVVDDDGQLRLGDVSMVEEVPKRTDGREVAVVDFQLKSEVSLEPWEKLTAQQMREILEGAQRESPMSELVVCAGCGRCLEPPFLELDHNMPKSLRGENVITNRILICRPCNGYKSNKEQFGGLWQSNVSRNWMLDGEAARKAYNRAVDRGREVKAEMRG